MLKVTIYMIKTKYMIIIYVHNNNYSDIIMRIYLLLTKFMVRTVSYSLCFFPFDLRSYIVGEKIRFHI